MSTPPGGERTPPLRERTPEELAAFRRNEMTKAALAVLKFWSVMERDLVAHPVLDLQTHGRGFMLAMVHDTDLDFPQMLKLLRMADRITGQYTNLDWLEAAMRDLAKETAVKTGAIQ